MREYLLVLLVTAAVTYLLTPLVRRVAIATGAMHEPRARDTHTKPTPLLGGLAMYGGLVAGLIMASRLTFLADPFANAGSRTAAGLLLAGALVVVVGFIDDRWGLSAVSKLAGQVAAAGILVWSGQALPWVPTPSGGVFLLEQDLSVTLTILLVVVTINAINFIDGLDGLAAGIVAVAALSFLVYSYTLIRTIGITSQSLPAVSSALLAGMCIGFLPHNFYPARIFMGDIGAMLLGLMLAYGPISSTASLDPTLLTNYAQPHTLDRFPTILPLLVPAAIFIIPYADLMFAIIRRTRAGKPLMAADRQHLHHRLLNIGHSYRQSVLIMYLWAALFSVTVVSLSVVRTRLVVFEAATLVAVLTLLPVTMPQLRPWSWRKPVPVAAAKLPRSGRVVPAPAAVVSRRAAPAREAAPFPTAAPFPGTAPFPAAGQPQDSAAPFPRAQFAADPYPAAEAPPLPGGSLPHAGRLPEPETVNPVTPAKPVSPLGPAYPADGPDPLPKPRHRNARPR
jgi:UDP-GlcNAc:undecaprenyl-phosphate/decaprenyl-phosphate GlcNAc-1-phosphate transferase